MIPSLSECKSPIRPTHYNVVVAVDVVNSTTAGGIIIPEKHKEREDAASEKGLIVEISPMAFAGGDWELEPAKPAVGDVVMFQRYAGKEIEMDSGDIKYRVISDDDIKGIIQ